MYLSPVVCLPELLLHRLLLVVAGVRRVVCDSDRVRSTDLSAEWTPIGESNTLIGFDTRPTFCAVHPDDSAVFLAVQGRAV